MVIEEMFKVASMLGSMGIGPAGDAAREMQARILEEVYRSVMAGGHQQTATRHEGPTIDGECEGIEERPMLGGPKG